MRLNGLSFSLCSDIHHLDTPDGVARRFPLAKSVHLLEGCSRPRTDPGVLAEVRLSRKFIAQMVRFLKRKSVKHKDEEETIVFSSLKQKTVFNTVVG
jgi:hypothetical protein